MHTAKLRGIGGSISVTLPRQLVRQLGLEAGHVVEITSDGQALKLSRTHKRYNLAQMLLGMKPGDMPAAPGWDSESPNGRAAW